MTRMRVLAALVVLSHPLVAQQGSWVWVNPYPTGALINQLYFRSSLDGFLLGNSGSLLHTSDAGNTWQQSSLPENNSYFKMFFASTLSGWILGQAQSSGLSLVLRTSDGGSTWAGQSLPSSRFARDLFFLGPSTGWIVGDDGLIFQTTDGGATWQDRSIVGTSPPSFYFVRFSSPSHGIALGRSFNNAQGFTVAQSSNGGGSWTLRTTGLQNYMYGAEQPSGASLVTVGTGGLILKSVDLGQNWSFPMGLPLSDLTAIDFYDSLVGIAVGAFGRIVRTSNGGAVWSEILPGVSQQLTSVQFISRDTVIVGGSGTGFPAVGPAILLSTDGGFVWNNKARFIEDQFQVNGLSPYARGRCWIAGDRFIYGTADSGLTWRQMRATTGDALLDVVAIDSLNGVAVGNRSGQGLIVRTTNAGTTWSSQTFGITYTFYKAAFPSPDSGYVVGESGTILKTTNRGQSWFPLPSGTTNPLINVRFVSPDVGFVISGTWIVRTTDGGQAWTQITVSQSDALQGISFPTANVGYAAGYSSLYKTTDGGLSWVQFPSSLYGLEDIAFGNENRGWAATFDAISTTTNGGLTWTTEAAANGPSRFGLLPGEDLWLGGRSTNVLRHVGSPLVGVQGQPEPTRPVAFSLRQNYPNPFNPATVIGFDVPVTIRVTLTVYDILGKEVVRLVDEVRTPGSYRVTWNGSGFASGVYFCRMHAGSFNDMKRFVLVK